MCGIVGFIGNGERQTLQAMRDTLTHRGPDAAGDYVDAAAGVFLGHRRLAIVDLSRGQQPMHGEDGHHVLVFNGEIYNHPELKGRLESRGHRYQTDCDSETILHAYREWGVDCVHELDGMFAFVIYDKQRCRLFGARDRFGKKPLYYHQSNATQNVEFAFASELKALRAHPGLCDQMGLSMDNVISYLLNDYVVGERCIFENVRQLEPGTAFTYDLNSSGQRFERTRYWEPDLDETNARQDISFDAASAQLLELFEQSIRRRLMSDVPLGAFISGGIDSAAVVSMMTKIMPAKEVKTFCIGFQESSFDESPYAKTVADHFGTDHYERQFTAADMVKRLPSTIESMDQPFADPSILPVSMLSEFAREHVTVALGGDGGDEVFVGYDPFRAVGPASFCRRFIPASLRRGLFKTLANAIPASDRNLSLNLKINRFQRGLDVPVSAQAPVWMGAFSLPQLRHLLPDHCASRTYAQAYPEATQAFEALASENNRCLSGTVDFFQRFYLPDDILVKVDRASMLQSLEVRCPFLDRDLCAFANRLPLDFKYRRGETKRILRHLALDPNGLGIPPTIVNRKKKGFGIPIGQWMRGQLRNQFEQSLVHEWPDRLDMFNRDYIRELFTDHVNRTADHYKELWALYVLAQWTENNFSPSDAQRLEASTAS